MDAIDFHGSLASRFGLNELFIGQGLRFAENCDFTLLDERQEVIQRARRAVLMATRPGDGVEIRKVPKNFAPSSQVVKESPETLFQFADENLPGNKLCMACLKNHPTP